MIAKTPRPKAAGHCLIKRNFLLWRRNRDNHRGCYMNSLELTRNKNQKS